MAERLLYTGTCPACKREHRVELEHSPGIEPPALVGAYCMCTVPSRGIPLTVRGPASPPTEGRSND